VSPIVADPGQIEQVLMNLVVNARDAMPTGGRVTITTGNREVGGHGALRPSSLRPGAYVVLTVSDTGCGMDEHTQSHLFEPFFTTKETGKGTGLGLATVYGIVKRAEGHIAVESKPGQGSTFTIYLPRAEQQARLSAAPEAPSKPAPGKETVLVVEDDGSVRSLACKILAINRYKVLEASNGPEALRLTSDRGPEPIHLLLTDVVMPEMSGPLLADHLKHARPGLRVLYMSGYPAEALGPHGVLEPGAFFLQKPFTPVSLANKVREALDHDPGGASGKEKGQ
jgi:CheY-like chemotaxis protein